MIFVEKIKFWLSPSEAVRDAERYRWLRENVGGNWITAEGHTFIFHNDKALFLGGDVEAFDKAVDNAITQTKINS